MKKIAIIGAGISGLFIANLFKQNPNYKITIFEKKESDETFQGFSRSNIEISASEPSSIVPESRPKILEGFTDIKDIAEKISRSLFLTKESVHGKSVSNPIPPNSA